MSRNRCQETCDCGATLARGRRYLPLDAPGLLTEDAYFREIGWPDCPYRGNLGHGWVYNDRALSDEPRFLRIDCEVCGRIYAGWYEHVEEWEPGGVREVWHLFDTSFFFAFNDEPSGRDEENARPVTACSACNGHGLVAVAPTPSSLPRPETNE